MHGAPFTNGALRGCGVTFSRSDGFTHGSALSRAAAPKQLGAATAEPLVPAT